MSFKRDTVITPDTQAIAAMYFREIQADEIQGIHFEQIGTSIEYEVTVTVKRVVKHGQFIAMDLPWSLTGWPKLAAFSASSVRAAYRRQFDEAMRLPNPIFAVHPDQVELWAAELHGARQAIVAR